MKRLIILSGLLILTGWLLAFGQSKDQANKLGAIPLESKRRLDERLNLYVKLLRSQDYSRANELISESSFQGHRFSKAEFLAGQQKLKSSGYKLLKFTPTSSSYDEFSGAYKIYGQAKEKRKGETATKELVIYAWLQNGNWYFSPFLEELVNITDP